MLHHFRCIRSIDRHGGLAGSFASRSTPHLQAFCSPQAVHFLLDDLDAVVETQVRPRPTEPVAWILAGVGACVTVPAVRHRDLRVSARAAGVDTQIIKAQLPCKPYVLTCSSHP